MRRRSRRRAALVAAAIALVLVLGGLVVFLAYRAGSRQGAAPALRRSTLLLPADVRLDVPVAPALALAPAGDLLVYGARRGDAQQLWQRGLDRAAAAPIPGTEGAAVPFLSPDGAWIGFFAGGRMAKVAAGGGEPVTLARSPYPFGASWGEDGRILYAPDATSGLWRVPAAGGDPVEVTRPDAAAGELGHWWPQVLPGGRAALFTAWRGSVRESRIELLDLASGERRVLLEGASFPRYAAGYLVCVRGDGVAAAPFDVAKTKLLGEPAAALDGVAIDPRRGSAQLALAPNGTLVYLPAEGLDSWSLLRVAPDGAVAALPHPPGAYRNVAASPDGARLAFTVAEEGGSALWIAERDGANRRRVAGGGAIEPVWSADGRRLFFAGPANGVLGVLVVAADGSAPPRPLLPPPSTNTGEPERYPGAASADGRALLYVEEDAATGADVWLLPLADGEPSGAPQPLLRTPAMERGPSISPDGRWLAWSSNESGRFEVYLRGFHGERLQLSRDGGRQSRWSPDGRRLWYRSGERLLVVDVGGEAGADAGETGTDAGAPVGEPRVAYRDPDLDRFAVLPDGSLVVVGRDPRTAQPPRLELVLGWPQELARLTGR